MSESPACAVFDLDGTLTDTRHRDHWVSARPRRWDRFFAAAGGDDPHPEGLAAARSAAGSGWQVVYLSGRPEHLRGLTEDWLRRFGCPDGELLLRPDHDRSPAVAFKLRTLRLLARTRRLVLLVDDDPDVIEAVATAGLVAHALLADWQPRTPSTPQEG